MLSTNSANKSYQVPFRSFTPFLLISFGLAWGIIGLYIFLPEIMVAVFGQITGNHPLFYLAVYAPAIAAFTIVARTSGIAGLRHFLGRALLWRCRAAWYAFLIIGVPLIFIVGSALRGNLLTEPFPFETIPSVIMALVLAAIKGPVEEFGWRGLALPLLQSKFVPIWAGLVLGVIWGFWHLPAFMLSGTQQSEWSFAAFFAGCLAISVIATALFNQSQGSILLSAFFHFMLMNPVFPDAQPYDTYILIFVAALIVLWNRENMFTSEGAVVEVIQNVEHRNG
ncbi:MAG: CPBP family intramembrane metalloprotease [Deltaproteobacteria bacterium]|jgi:membrane protease YdiL (CAAX protease family)|nr:CPBP family intramembrane metalloprotease [Deltaproteobacteria bacterium]